MRIRERFAWALLSALGLFVAAAMSGVVSGGPLDPPGPVGSTMKTLEEIPGSWSRVLGSSGTDSCNTQRFRCVLNNAGVLDHETGLVWQRTQFLSGEQWSESADACQAANTGGRRGWRLPSVEELQTLMDNASATGLPANHPFAANPSNLFFWTATQSNVGPGQVYVLAFQSNTISSLSRSSFSHRWCVRAADGGGGAVDVEAPLSPWYEKLSTSAGIIDPCNSQRFQCVMDDEAFLDRETGLVWQRDQNPVNSNHSWFTAGQGACLAAADTGGRQGWRLPTVAEFQSLMLPFIPPNTAGGLPQYTPVSASLTSGDFWTASEVAGDETRAYRIELPGETGADFVSALKTELGGKAWCVRGPSTPVH